GTPVRRPRFAPRGGVRAFFFQAADGIPDLYVTGVQTCALPIWAGANPTQHVAAVSEANQSPRPWRCRHAEQDRRGSAPSVAPARSEERRVGEEGLVRWLQRQSNKAN